MIVGCHECQSASIGIIFKTVLWTSLNFERIFSDHRHIPTFEPQAIPSPIKYNQCTLHPNSKLRVRKGPWFPSHPYGSLLITQCQRTCVPHLLLDARTFTVFFVGGGGWRKSQVKQKWKETGLKFFPQHWNASQVLHSIRWQKNPRTPRAAQALLPALAEGGRRRRAEAVAAVAGVGPNPAVTAVTGRAAAAAGIGTAAVDVEALHDLGVRRGVDHRAAEFSRHLRWRHGRRHLHDDDAAGAELQSHLLTQEQHLPNP